MKNKKIKRAFDQSSVSGMVSPVTPKSQAALDKKNTAAMKEQDRVAQSIYTQWIKSELTNEFSCFELPFTIMNKNFSCHEKGFSPFFLFFSRDE